MLLYNCTGSAFQNASGFPLKLASLGALPDGKVQRQGDMGLNRDSDRQTQPGIRGGGASCRGNIQSEL